MALSTGVRVGILRSEGGEECCQSGVARKGGSEEERVGLLKGEEGRTAARVG